MVDGILCWKQTQGSRNACQQEAATASPVTASHCLTAVKDNFCVVQGTQIGLVTSLIFLAYLYFLFYYIYIRRATRMLANESYAKYKYVAFLAYLSVALVLAYQGH